MTHMPLFGERKKEYQIEWMAKRRKEFFAGRRCEECGDCEDLELDHIDPSQKVSHRIWSWSQIRREEELSKCQVLCKVCHKKKTREQMIVKEHGLTMYANHNCRCDICCESLRQHWRDYRARKKLGR